MKSKIVYLLDHVHDDLAFDQKCQIHDKDWLSEYFDILYVIRTLRPTYTKHRANFIIRAFNHLEPFEVLLNEIKTFKPDILHIFGPLMLGNTIQFIDNLYGSCKIIQQYAGSIPQYYWNDKIDYMIIDKVHESVFQHVPPDRIITRNNCCDLSFFHPIENEKEFDVIMAGGFYASKGQDIVYRALRNEPVKIMFAGSQKSNMGEPLQEFRDTQNLIRPTDKATVIFKDFSTPAEMPMLYNKSKVAVWGSKTSLENPITITNRFVTEAIACGLPFVGFKETFQHSNFIIDKKNAILVNTETEFTEAVMNIVNNEFLRLRLRLGSLSLKDVIDFDIWHNKLIKDLYEKILKTTPISQ
jgi:glycosyltransferase involved in cell wall biosynthesis